MRPEPWLVSIVDMLEAVDTILEYTTSVTKDEFLANRMMFDAVVRQFTILGEGANRISPDVQQQFPDLPWPEMRGLRNFVVHEYDEVNRHTIWDAVQQDLPALRVQLLQILDNL
jgi:uncharacterized protein with HEPN domain